MLRSYNGVLAINQTALQIRTQSSVGNIQGMFFSYVPSLSPLLPKLKYSWCKTYLRTFFGGNDATWASPTNQSTYYRNFQLFGSDDASTLKSSASRSRSVSLSASGMPVLSALLLATVGLAAVRLASVL